ncbi:MAG: patatin-like phospholipase family protein [Christensenellaceae bacterium]|jgi:NTE family protein|nr:patatin-like phospholipase family protein [Christensenellaceae bacterium]
MKDLKVGLCLGGGAALGIAHVGVLEELVKNNIKIDMITGTSIGSLVGGAFASGVEIDKMLDLVDSFKRHKIVDLNLNPLYPDGVMRGRHVEKYLNDMVGGKTFDDLKIPFRCVACDLKTGREVIFDSGDLAEAVRASISVPLAFSPVKKENMILIDGGVVNNLPVDVLRALGADVVIAVDLCGTYKPFGRLKNVFEVSMSSVHLMLKNQVDIQKDRGDVFISVYQPDVSPAFFRKSEMQKSLEYGRAAAAAVMDDIKKLVTTGKKPKKAEIKETPINISECDALYFAEGLEEE